MTASAPGPSGTDAVPEATPAPLRVAWRDGVDAALAPAAAVAALVLVATSTGTLLVVAVLVAVARSDRRVGAVVGLAAVVVAVRFGTVDLGHLAGAQEVLGPAGRTGTAMAAASSWTSAVAVAMAGWRAGTDGGLADRAVSVALGLTAAAVVWGPGPSALVGRVLAAVVGVGVVVGGAHLVARLPDALRSRWLPRLAVAAAVVAAGLAVVGT